MESLRKELRILKLNITRLKTQMDDICKKKPIDIENLSKLESIMSMYFANTSKRMEDVINQMLSLLSPDEKSEDKKFEEKLLAELSELIDIGSTFQGRIKAFHSKLSTEKSRQSITSSPLSAMNRSFNNSMYPKLKEIEPPKFDGDLSKFFEWKNLFENLVHNNDELLNVQKLWYLKKAMIKDVEGLLDDFGMADEAYAEAWIYVLARFEKKRSIILAHFRKLTSLEQLKDETGIQKLLDKVNGVIRGLKAAGERVDDTFSKFITFLVGLKLDATTFRDWENSLVSVDNYPKFEELSKFLQNRAFAVDDRSKYDRLQKHVKKNSTEQKSYATVKGKCVLCSNSHYLNQCSEFLSKKPQDRYEIVKKNRLCLICFNFGHAAYDCNSRFSCKCGAKHHALLHFEFKSSKNNSSNNSLNSSSGSSPNIVKQPNAESKAIDKPVGETLNANVTPVAKSSLSCLNSIEKFVVLPSAIVEFVCGNISGTCRVLLDSCSQPNLISDAFVRKFKLPVNSINHGNLIKGVSSSSLETSQSISLKIVSNFKSFQVDIVADVVPASSISYTTFVNIAPVNIEKLKKFRLADPAFLQENVSISNIDLIIGAEHFEKIMCDKSHSFDNSWFICLSQFGWVVSGVAPQANKINSVRFTGCTLQEIDLNLRRFWEIEEVALPNSIKSNEIDQFEQHFEKTYAFAPDGKFVIRLPFKVDRSVVSTNRTRALSNIYKIERSLNEDLRQKYVDFMREYFEAGHMSLVGPTSKPHYFIPHREVVRLESVTTPLRVVFNASSAVKGSSSLNDALMVGANIQRDLFDILISMRTYKFCFTADIAKMYRMIWVHEDDRDMQRIFWREKSNEPICEYCLNTVTYGTVSASFIATKCLQIVANELNDLNPIAARLIKDNFYMDDLIGGANTEAEIVELQSVIHAALAKRGFQLRKYASNCDILLGKILPELLATKSMVEFDNVAVLGLRWNSSDDMFGVKTNIEDFRENCVLTKRIVLSYISRVFDPLGLVSPVTVRGKLIMQSLWLEGKSWDDPISESLSSLFANYMRDLVKLRPLVIPRDVLFTSQSELIAFCDASQKAYCVIIYVRSRNIDGSYNCKMLCSKNRIAPIRALTIPRLELIAATLAVSLISRIASILNVKCDRIHAFSDSTIVLCWLSKPSNNWKLFVTNRVRKIINFVPFDRWHYVPTSQNPADLATRGLDIDTFLNTSLWTNGPNFLLHENAFSYFEIPNLDVHNALEQRKNVVLNVIYVDYFLDHFSSYVRMIRTIAYLYRFINLCKLRQNIDVDLTNFELDRALNTVICLSQKVCFREDISRLINKLPLKKKSPLYSLDPFLDENKILRVGGRLEHSNWSMEKKHPIIVNAKSHFARLLVRYTHEKYFHAGRTFLASFFSSQYWFVNGRTNLFKFVLRTCVICIRLKGKVAKQLMGQLPASRVSISRAFTYVGVDFGGPFQCKCVAHRTTRFYKIYMAIFVCLTIRAIHIELVSDLSTAKFLETLQRFIARRGLPAKIFSDNATNFSGASNFFKLHLSDISNFASSNKFEWHFIPPRSPHFGGIWEAAVKSVKFHLSTVVKDTVLSFEEYLTLTTKVEAMLNSRPIAYKQNVEQGCEPLTPAHFLIGQSLLATPVIDENTSISLSNRLQLLQNLLKGFWSRWSKDYLNDLQQRSKWTSRQPNIQAGQLVFVREENQPPFKWPLGLVERCHQAKDGCVRVVDVRFNDGVRSRSLSSIVPIPPASEPSGSAWGSLLKVEPRSA